MGYYTKIIDVSADLPEESLGEAYARLVELNSHDEWKKGGGYSGGERVSKWFSWMPSDYPDKFETVAEILMALGFNVSSYDGGISIDGYNDKAGSEDVFVWYISDLFTENSFIHLKGEDGEEYRWEFGGGEKMTESVAITTWTSKQPFEPFNFSKIFSTLTKE